MGTSFVPTIFVFKVGLNNSTFMRYEEYGINKAPTERFLAAV
jgi:hypothetical protein